LTISAGFFYRAHMKKIFLLSACLVFTACKDTQTTVIEESGSITQNVSLESLPSLRKQLVCLPKEAAFVAAHRGTSKKEGLAENAGSSLEKLMDRGIMIAEIDVAGLKDGTHILFHDGVWDEKSSGKGPVASTTWNTAKDYLLRDTDGDFSADRPIKFSDTLKLAKNRLYLEVDFKSSAKYEKVIDAIREAGMEEQVILISYSDGQARKLAKLAPDMMLSVGAKSKAEIKALEDMDVKAKNMAVWMGSGPYKKSFIAYLDKREIPVLAWPKEGARKKALGPAAVAVTDYALQKKPIEGLNAKSRAVYEKCLGGG